MFGFFVVLFLVLVTKLAKRQGSGHSVGLHFSALAHSLKFACFLFAGRKPARFLRASCFIKQCEEWSFLLFISTFLIFEAHDPIQRNIYVVFILKEWKLLGFLWLSDCVTLYLTDLSPRRSLAKQCVLSRAMQETQRETSLDGLLWNNWNGLRLP